ncbi:MAG: hemerythrin domain-containing protein [Bdellovibrionales bacterium]|nr:hemerythrin domain-containing protein [Bdellovibrionales bacterium]
MKALDLLRADHRQLGQLFEQVRQTQDFAERRELFEDIRDRLDWHSSLEEEIFYPRFLKASELSELMSESMEDHQLMREIVGELSTTYDREDFNELLEELIDTIEDHVAEEESEVFPRLLGALSDDEWSDLYEKMIQRSNTAEAA